MMSLYGVALLALAAFLLITAASSRREPLPATPAAAYRSGVLTALAVMLGLLAVPPGLYHLLAG